MWAPWRMDYILGPKPDGCVLCRAVEEGEDRRGDNLILAVAPHVFIIMNRFPYAHGHVMVVPRRHVSRLDDLDKDERDAFFETLFEAQAAVRKAFEPQGMNIGMNLGKIAGAGIDDHVHAHVVPRWAGDTNFMPVLAEVKVMPEHLATTYNGLVPYFAHLDHAD